MLKRTEPLKTGWKKSEGNSLSQQQQQQQQQQKERERKTDTKETVKMSRLCKAGLFFLR